MKMRNKRKALHRKYAGAKKAFNSFVRLYQGEMAQRYKGWRRSDNG